MIMSPIRTKKKIDNKFSSSIFASLWSLTIAFWSMLSFHFPFNSRQHKFVTSEFASKWKISSTKNWVTLIEWWWRSFCISGMVYCMWNMPGRFNRYTFLTMILNDDEDENIKYMCWWQLWFNSTCLFTQSSIHTRTKKVWCCSSSISLFHPSSSSYLHLFKCN